MMQIDELIKIDFTGKNVLIIGCPASGKTFLSNKICNGTHHKIHGDEFIKDGYFMGVYAILNELSFIDKPTLIETVQGYRLVRKGAEYASYYPDVIIRLSISKQRQEETYLKERDAGKLKYLKNFNKVNDKILQEGLSIIPKERKPELIEIYNDY